MNNEPKSQTKYRFGEFVLDASRGTVCSTDQILKLRPKVYEALLYLLQNPGRLIAKDELIHTLWGDSFVTEDSLVQCMVELRRALNDREQEIVETVPRRGYILKAPVTAHENGNIGNPSTVPAEEIRRVAARRLPGRYHFPLPRTPLVGRERELLNVRNLLLSPGTRLVTLTGAGGCGKTRLGLEVASELLERFE